MVNRKYFCWHCDRLNAHHCNYDPLCIYIDAEGDWEIEVTQPRPTEGELVPFSATGTSDDVLGPIYLTSGLHIFEMSHEGNANFIVHLVNLDGDVVEYLANEIGEADLTQAAGIDQTGIYYLDVMADSDWSVSIE